MPDVDGARRERAPKGFEDAPHGSEFYSRVSDLLDDGFVLQMAAHNSIGDWWVADMMKTDDLG